MFKINCRIVNSYKEIESIDSELFNKEYNHIEGFFEICFGNHREGCYYHDNPIQEGEEGDELLDWWLNLLVDVAEYLPKTNYVAFNEPETTVKWIEFKLIGDNVIINTAIDSKEMNSRMFITEPFNEFDYVKPLNFSVEFIQFKSEVIGTVNSFITKLEDLNPELLKTKMVSSLVQKISNLD